VKYFSGIADETSDKLLDGGDEQLSLFLRFVKTTRSISRGLFMFLCHLLSVIREELTDCIITTSSQSGLGFYFFENNKFRKLKFIHPVIVALQ